MYSDINTDTTNRNNYDDTGSFNDNNISQYTLCTSRYMSIQPHSYILCIPQVPYSTTKMDVARAVENQLLTSGKGTSANIEHFEYVKNVIFIRAFDQTTFDEMSGTNLNDAYGFETTNARTSDPWYKIAFVNIDIPPGYSENGIWFYTNGEDAFYNGVCRGDIVINSWTGAFFVAHPTTYFQQSQTQLQQQQHEKKKTKSEECEYQDSAFQKWKYEFKLKQLERKVKEYENTIRQNELDAIRSQNTVNEYAESIRFLTRRRLESPELQGLSCASIQMTSFNSVLSNRYARVCVSDTTFLEANRNMKLKEMNGHVINACDDCDACQELIHSIDHVRPEECDEVFASIEQVVCRISKSVQRFEKLHVNAERSLFGLRNRRVFEDFGTYLNTALEIMEEVTSRVSTFTQDLEYAKCYGQLNRYNQQQHQQHHNGIHNTTPLTLGYGYNYDYDYAEDADQVYENECDGGDNAGVESTQQMLDYFDQHNMELYKQQQQEQQQETSSPESKVDIGKTVGVYHEEAVIVEGEEDVVKSDTKVKVVIVDEKITKSEVETTTAFKQETQQQEKRKSGGWLSSWF